MSQSRLLPVLSLLLSAGIVLTLPLSAQASSDPAIPNITDNAPTCHVQAVGGDDTSGEHPEGRIAANGNEVTGYVEVTGVPTCKVDVTLTTWKAPNGFDGKPYDQQELFDTKTLQFSIGTHDITTHLPGCYYQADLVRGDKATGYDNGPIYEDGRMMASLHGGTASCELSTDTEQPDDANDPSEPANPGQGSNGKAGESTTSAPTTSKPVTSTPTTPVTPITTTELMSPAVLPETGAKLNALLLAAIGSLLAGLGYSRYQRSKSSRTAVFPKINLL